MNSIQVEVGRLLCGRVRSMLDSFKFLGEDIEYMESSGWFQRTFTIKGSSESLNHVSREFDHLIDRLNSVDSESRG